MRRHNGYRRFKADYLTNHLPTLDYFCNEKWYEHKDEIFLWTGDMVDYDSKYYYNKHRWLLKSMFKEQKND